MLTPDLVAEICVGKKDYEKDIDSYLYFMFLGLQCSGKQGVFHAREWYDTGYSY